MINVLIVFYLFYMIVGGWMIYVLPNNLHILKVWLEVVLEHVLQLFHGRNALFSFLYFLQLCFTQ